ncbi:MAG: hypothetical protein AB1635_21920, partial [Acidobacteriota bacterium]
RQQALTPAPLSWRYRQNGQQPGPAAPTSLDAAAATVANTPRNTAVRPITFIFIFTSCTMRTIRAARVSPTVRVQSGLKVKP